MSREGEEVFSWRAGLESIANLCRKEGIARREQIKRKTMLLRRNPNRFLRLA
jgi:hypothetical protein